MLRARSVRPALTAIGTAAVLAFTTVGLSPFVAAAAGEPSTEEEKTIYFLGVMMSRQAKDLALSREEAEFMVKGLRDSLDGKAMKVDPSEYLPKLQEMATERREIVLERARAESKTFLAEAAEAKGANVTESGLVITEIKAGTGGQPSPTDTVRVHYHGTLRDGSVFDSSVQRGEPAEFPLNRVIPCWTEGVAMIKVGGKSKLVCPPDIAYGDRGMPPTIPGGAVLTFEVELLDIVTPATP